MSSEACFFGLVVGIGCFVVDYVDAFYGFGYEGVVDGVGAVGVAMRWHCGGGEPLVGHDSPVGQLVVGALFYGMALGDRHVVEVDHFAVDVAQFGFFAEYISHAGHAMVEGECLYDERFVFVDYGPFGLYDVEFQLIGAFAAEEIEDTLE